MADAKFHDTSATPKIPSNAVLIGRDLNYDQRKPMMKQYAMDWRLAHGGALTTTEAAHG